MELSLDFIAEKLKGRYDVALSCPDPSPKFAKARVFSRDRRAAIAPETLVIASAATCDPADLEGCRGAIWLGDGKPPASVPTIWLPHAAKLMEVLDDVLDILERHASWCEQARNALLEQKPISDVVRLLGQVTRNPFWYGDTALRVLFMSDDEYLAKNDSIWSYQVEHGRYSAETLSELIASGDLEKINGERRAWLFKNSKTFNKGSFVSKTIVCNGNIYGYAFIIEVVEDSSVCDIELLDMLGDLIASYIEHSRIALPASSRIADQMLKECLLGSFTSKHDLNDLSNLLKWDLDDNFVISVFETNHLRHSSKDILKAQVHMLEDNLPGRVISFESHIMLINNMTKYPNPDLGSSLESLCRKLDWNAGMSRQFQGLENLSMHYQQAKTALRLGLEEHPKGIVYDFNDYSVFFLCDHLAKQVPESLLIHQDVRRIAAYDAETDGNLLETLEIYLNNERSVAKTASELFLHRNSVAYRIDKIRSLMKTDLDDDENRLNVILSLKAWPRLHPAR